MSEIRHTDENNLTHYTNQFDFRNKDSKILQDPCTPHDNKLNNFQKTKKLSQINNIVSEEYGKLNHYVKNQIYNENDQKKLDRLRV